MSAPSNAKSAAPASSGSGEKGGFYLRPRTKVWILGICLALMIAASVYAVLQSLSPDPLDTSFSARLRYPHETNPYARLQAVRCANDYACRLNSVAVNGTGDLPEVWAVGNVGLVLHRKAGETKWEQLTINVQEESASAPPPTPTATPVAKPTATPRSSPRPAQSVTPASTPAPSPTPTPTPTPAPSPTPAGVLVPNLIGLTEQEARKAAGSFPISIGYEKGSAPSPMAQQGPPADLRVTSQSPAPGAVATPGAVITITLGRPRSKANLLDLLVPRVYAAEPEKQGSPTPQSKSTPVSNGQVPPQPSHTSTLDDDLIYVICQTKECRALGRSGRIYKIENGNPWRFRQAVFEVFGANGGVNTLSLVLATDSGGVIGKSGRTYYSCLGIKSQEVLDMGDSLVCSAVDLLVWEALKPAVGVAATLKFIPDRDTVEYRSIASGTNAALHSLSFDSNTHGFIVGDHGIILSSTDGGNTWRHETQGPEGVAPNRRLPALWYWLAAGLLVVTCSAAVAIPPPPPPTEFSVADWTVTDAPLKPGDVDSLGFTPMALGLSRFIRNPKTQPPVTIAIEGEWGEGKSSVMSLLRCDLEKSRFRPVWFNAWHHQSEEQLLAALLEHIKDQAVPPWWHIDNWIFRARLVHFRFREKWPLLIVFVLALCGSVAYELSRHGLKLEDFADFGKDVIALIKYLLPWSSQKDLPKDLGHFSVLATMLAIVAAIFKKAKAFGINPAKLTDNLRDAATIKDVKPDPGVRPRFAREFGDVCKAWSWGGRRVIIFIDDLDRCRPESVVTVLESINFLTTAGDCMIVLGMAQNQVTHCVGLGFKDIAHAEAAYHGGGNTEQEKAVARYNYGAFYIKKLVNIVAPLPKTTPDQRRRVLEARAAEVRRQAEEDSKQAPAAWRTAMWNWASQAGRMAWKAAPVLCLVLAVMLSVWIGYRQGSHQGNQQQGTGDSSQATTGSGTAQSQSGSTAKLPESSPSGKVTGAAKPLIYERPTSERARLEGPDQSAGGVWWSYAVDALFLLLLFGILAYQFSARTNQDAQNSPEFEDSLKLWGQYIVGVCDTPREIKRALNDLRYQAMTRRSNGPSTTRGERLVRAVRQFVTGRAEAMPVETHVDEAALPPRKAAELASLTEPELITFLDPHTVDTRGSQNLQRLLALKREHLKLFQRWIGEVTPVTAPLAQGAENAPPARAAHQA